MYNCDCTKEEVGFGAVSTEHFIMCSNSAKDIADYPDDIYEYKDIDPMRERVFLKKLLTKFYPNTSFSCVCDSYDYWNVVKNILPTLKDEILAHNGCMLIRGDSCDCVKVVTKTVEELWNIFGGTINSKGYKVLDPHVKAIYGDSITVERAEQIYEVLKLAGFAAQNVSLGVGSFSMHAIEEDGLLSPLTRDTAGVAIKANDAIINGVEYPIFKDPKTDRENGGESMKKSHKGCCRVFWRSKLDGEITYEDNLTYEESLRDNLMVTIFRDGKFIEDAEVSLSDVRNRLNNNNF
jgi:nicotinamide phosphoribosyltransferase